MELCRSGVLLRVGFVAVGFCRSVICRGSAMPSATSSGLSVSYWSCNIFGNYNGKETEAVPVVSSFIHAHSQSWNINGIDGKQEVRRVEMERVKGPMGKNSISVPLKVRIQVKSSQVAFN